jgi:hypothetical protein
MLVPVNLSMVSPSILFKMEEIDNKNNKFRLDHIIDELTSLILQQILIQ